MPNIRTQHRCNFVLFFFIPFTRIIVFHSRMLSYVIDAKRCVRMAGTRRVRDLQLVANEHDRNYLLNIVYHRRDPVFLGVAKNGWHRRALKRPKIPAIKRYVRVNRRPYVAITTRRVRNELSILEATLPGVGTPEEVNVYQQIISTCRSRGCRAKTKRRDSQWTPKAVDDKSRVKILSVNSDWNEGETVRIRWHKGDYNPNFGYPRDTLL